MRFSKIALASLVAATVSLTGAASAQSPSMEGTKVYFVNIKDGDTVKSPFKVVFGLSGMGVAPAGIDKKGTGHHHLIIDEKIEGEELEENIPKDEQHRHFGGGQTEAMVELPAGKHTLQLVLGDKDHIPHVAPVKSDVITVTVE